MFKLIGCFCYPGKLMFLGIFGKFVGGTLGFNWIRLEEFVGDIEGEEHADVRVVGGGSTRFQVAVASTLLEMPGVPSE